MRQALARVGDGDRQTGRAVLGCMETAFLALPAPQVGIGDDRSRREGLAILVASVVGRLAIELGQDEAR